MCSFAVRSDFASVVFLLLSLVAGAAIEELTPKFFDTGFPVLLSLSLVFSRRDSLVESLVAAFAAGAVEDALCGFPPATSATFFVAMALVARFLEMPRATIVHAYPLYIVWLWMWRIDTRGEVFLRLLSSVPLGIVTIVSVYFAVSRLMRRAGIA